MFFHRLSLVLALALLCSGCATITGSLQEQITEGQLDDAIADGNKWLQNKENLEKRKLAWEVKLLVAEASLLKAKRQDTVGAYRHFKINHDLGPRYEPLLTRATALEARAYYRDKTLRGGDTVAKHQRFRRLYPVAPDTAVSREREVELAWKQAGKANNLAAYTEFNEAYEKWQEAGKESATARKRASIMAFAAAEEQDTATGYAAYAASYKGWKEAAAQVKKALAAEVRVFYAGVVETATVKAHQGFRKQYGARAEAAEYVKKSRAAEVELAYQAAAKHGHSNAVRSFRLAYHSWPEAAEAIKKALVLEQALAWKEAQKVHTWKHYQAFLREHPQSPNAPKAEKLAHILRGLHAPRGLDEVRTVVNGLYEGKGGEATVYVQAYDEYGDPVGGLRRPLFSLFQKECLPEVLEFHGMEKDRPVDMIFVFDTTGSMRRFIDGVKAAAVQFAEGLALRNRDLRLGLVTFGDKVRKTLPKNRKLTKSVKTFRGWISKLEATGGKDYPENALDGLAAGAGFRFRKKAQAIFVLITDAPAHERNRHTRLTVRRVGRALHERGAMVFSISPGMPQYRALVSTVGGEVFDINTHRDFAALMMRISTMTAKQYRLKIRGCAPLRVGAAINLRVRARADHVWLQSAPVPGTVSSLMVYPNAHAKLLACTDQSGCFLSQDSGLKWRRHGKKTSHLARMLVTGPQGMRLFGLTATGAGYFSKDGGKTWRALATPKRFVALTQDPLKPSLLFAADGRKLLRSADGGKTWKTVGPSGVTGARLALLYHPQMKTLWMVGPGGRGRSSADGGKTWLPWKLTLPGGAPNLAGVRFFHHPYWGGMLFAVDPSGRLHRSLNQGRTWRQLKLPVAVGSSAAPRVRSLLFDPTKRHWITLSTDRGVLASRDNGRRWFSPFDGLSTADQRYPLLYTGRRGTLVAVGRRSGRVYTLNPVSDREFISGNVYFAFNSAKLSKRLHGYLKSLAAYLVKRPHKRVRIEGHTDDVGNQEYNKKLSLRRAASVSAFLVKHGVPKNRVFTAGYGKLRPLFPNSSPRNRARNRRVELTVVGVHKPLPDFSLASK